MNKEEIDNIRTALDTLPSRATELKYKPISAKKFAEWRKKVYGKLKVSKKKTP